MDVEHGPQTNSLFGLVYRLQLHLQPRYLFFSRHLYFPRVPFSLIDHDGDGVVNEQDLKHIFTSLGERASLY